MIPEKLHEQIPLYVMGELEPGDAAALEVMMARSSELRAEVRACADALGAVAAESSVPVPRAAAIWTQVERGVKGPAAGVLLSTARRETLHVSAQAMASRSGWRAWAWPAAAAVLLLLNLAQLWWWRAAPREGEPEGTAAERSAMGQGEEGHERPGVDASAASSTAGARGEPVAGAIAGGQAPAPDLAEAHRLLAERYEKLEREFEALSESVGPLLRVVIAEQRTHATPGSGLWAMELRNENDAPAIAGLWDRVRQLVPDNGVAIMSDRWRLAGGVVLDPAWWTSGNNANVGGDSARQDNIPPPYALAAFNGSEGLGYLDLYNLPTVAAGQELRLWMQAEGQTDYTAVGTVPPSLVGGSGGLAFRVPTSDPQPSRFLVTIEPASQSPQPTGRIVIDGP